MSLVSAAVVGGLAADLALGEPPKPIHPVKLFGQIIDVFDRSWPRPQLAGVAIAVGLPIAVAGCVGLLVFVVTSKMPVVGVFIAALAVFVTTSYRSLLTTVSHVSRLADDNLPKARAELRALAGRDSEQLTPEMVRSATLESLSENLSDGLVAPLMALTLAGAFPCAAGLEPALTLGLASGAGSWVKAVNTMDSMWGYPDHSLGTAAAYLDDTVMWVPARFTALLLAAAMGTPQSLARARSWTSGVASPNAGWPMGVLAAGLDVRLEKRGHYVLNPDGDLPTADDVGVALGRVSVAGLSAYALAGVLAWC